MLSQNMQNYEEVCNVCIHRKRGINLMHAESTCNETVCIQRNKEMKLCIFAGYTKVLPI
jgi:hypothetical protein